MTSGRELWHFVFGTGPISLVDVEESLQHKTGDQMIDSTTEALRDKLLGINPVPSSSVDVLVSRGVLERDKRDWLRLANQTKKD